MSLIDNYLKKKDDNIGIERPRSLLIDKYTAKKETPVVEIAPTQEPVSLIDRVKGVGRGVAQFAARTGVEVANLATSTLDFAADFLSGQVEKRIEEPSVQAGLFKKIKIGEKTESSKKMAERWKGFYERTGGAVTEKMKTFTEGLRDVDFIKPSEEWANASTKEKFTNKLPETILNIGPGVVSSLGMYALSGGAGYASSVGSVADELKTVAMENGVNKERAELLGLGTGLLVGWLDKIVPDEVFSPAQKKTFISGFAKRVLKTGLKEAGTEMVQENVQLLAEATVREDITKDEVVARNLMAGLGGVLGGVGAETTVSFVNGVRSGEIGGLEEDVDIEPEKKVVIKKEAPVVKKEEAIKFVSAKDFAEARFSAKEDQQIGSIDANRITPRDSVDKKSKEYIALKADVDKNGFKEPVRVTVEKGKIITTEGSHRVTLAQELDMKIPVIVNKGEIEGLGTIAEQFKEVVPAKPPKKTIEKKVKPIEKAEEKKPVSKKIIIELEKAKKEHTRLLSEKASKSELTAIVKKKNDLAKQVFPVEITINKKVGTANFNKAGNGWFNSKVFNELKNSIGAYMTENSGSSNILFNPTRNNMLEVKRVLGKNGFFTELKSDKVEVKKPTDLKTKTKEAVVSQVKEVKLVKEKSVQNVKNIKDIKNTLKTIRKNFGDLTLQVEGEAIIAQQQREGLNVKNINKLKRIFAKSKKFQEGDIETIRASNTGPLLNSVIENIQEKNPDMSEAEAFEFALDLPTQATAKKRTTAETRDLAKKEKTLSRLLKTLKEKQKDLDIEQDDALFKQWQEVVDAQEKLIKSIKVPKRQIPVGEGKEKVSRLQARLKGALKATSEEDIEELGLTTFRQMNQDKQIAMASEYVENNTEEALRVVRGEIDPPKGILQNSVFAALVELGKIDTDVATQVATLTSTRFGQEINILKKILADNPVVMMQDIVKTRIEAYEKRTGRKVSEKVKTETKKITKKAKKTTQEQWNLFVESIRC